MFLTPTSTPPVATEDNDTPAVVSAFEDDDNDEGLDEDESFFYNDDDDDDDDIQNVDSGTDTFNFNLNENNTQNDTLAMPPSPPPSSSSSSPTNHSRTTPTVSNSGNIQASSIERVRIIGGVHVGKMGTFVSRTPQRIAVLIDGVTPPTIRYLAIHHVEFINSSSASSSGSSPNDGSCARHDGRHTTTNNNHINNQASTHRNSTVPQSRPTTNTTAQQELEVGQHVNVIGGTYRGQSGEIQRLTPQKVWVVLDHDDSQISRCIYKYNVVVVLQTNQSAPNDEQPGERIERPTQDSTQTFTPPPPPALSMSSSPSSLISVRELGERIEI